MAPLKSTVLLRKNLVLSGCVVTSIFSRVLATTSNVNVLVRPATLTVAVLCPTLELSYDTISSVSATFSTLPSSYVISADIPATSSFVLSIILFPSTPLRVIETAFLSATTTSNVVVFP